MNSTKCLSLLYEPITFIIYHVNNCGKNCYLEFLFFLKEKLTFFLANFLGSKGNNKCIFIKITSAHSTAHELNNGLTKT